MPCYLQYFGVGISVNRVDSLSISISAILIILSKKSPPPPNHKIPNPWGEYMLLNPTSQSFKVNLGTIIFPARKSGGLNPLSCYMPNG